MGDVRGYDPTPPPAEKLDVNNFPLKLAKLQVDTSKKGLQKYRITLSNETRSAHLSDPINGGNWRNLILDFDRKFPSLNLLF